MTYYVLVGRIPVAHDSGVIGGEEGLREAFKDPYTRARESAALASAHNSTGCSLCEASISHPLNFGVPRKGNFNE